MTLDRQSAAASLAAIEQAERRTATAVFYGIAGSFLLLWGGITAAGYVFGQFLPARSGIAWVVLQCLGFAITITMVARRRGAFAPTQRKLGWQLIAAQAALIGFAFLILAVTGPLSARQLGAFWPLVFMLGYVLAGIWTGRFFVLCGIAIALLTLAGFWWAGPWFQLWMAVVNGAPLMLGGLWLRRQGAER